LKSFFYLLLLWLLIMINFQFPLDTNLFLGSESSCMLDSGWNFLFFFLIHLINSYPFFLKSLSLDIGKHSMMSQASYSMFSVYAMILVDILMIDIKLLIHLFIQLLCFPPDHSLEFCLLIQLQCLNQHNAWLIEHTISKY
jgi:hypothetical protein